MRYQVRPSHSDDRVTLWRVWDSASRVYTDTFTREPLAEACQRRLQAAWDAHLSRARAVAR